MVSDHCSWPSAPPEGRQPIGEWGEMIGTSHFNIEGALGDMPAEGDENLQLIAERSPRARQQCIAAE